MKRAQSTLSGREDNNRMTVIAHQGDKVSAKDSVLFIRDDGKLQVENSSVQPAGVYTLEDVAIARGWIPAVEVEPEQLTLVSRLTAIVKGLFR